MDLENKQPKGDAVHHVRIVGRNAIAIGEIATRRGTSVAAVVKGIVDEALQRDRATREVAHV